MTPLLRRSVIALLLALFALGIVMGFASGLDIEADTLSIPGLLAMGPFGAVLAAKRPANPIGWLFLVTASMTSCILWAGAVVDHQGDAASWQGAPALALWFFNFAWFPVIAICTVMVPLLFPQGWLSRHWRRWGIALIIWYSAFLVIISLSPTLETDAQTQVANPLSPSWLPTWSDQISQAIWTFGMLSLFLGAVSGVLCVGLRYWRGTSDERVQIRWFVTAVAFVLIGAVLSGTGGGQISEVAFGFATVFIPLATWIAITRHGLYELDRIISRTLAYILVTGVVIATYAALVTTITRLLPTSSRLAVTIATLCAAAIFQPLLRVVRGVIDRRFNRAHYDALETVDRFTNTLRTTIDADVVHEQLGSAITRTLQPSSYSVWTRQ